GHGGPVTAVDALRERPAGTAPAGPGRPPSSGGRRHQQTLGAAVGALVVAACLPLARVFAGLEFLAPVLGAALLSLGLSWGCRRLGAGPLLTLLVSIVGWVALVGVAFLPDTLAAGVLPTPATWDAGLRLWLRALELVRIRAAPAFADPPLLLLTVTGVWFVAHGVDALVAHARAPLQAVALAMVLWTVPLVVAPPGGRAWAWAWPLLAASAALLLGFAGDDLTRWGTWVDPWTGRVPYRGGANPLVPAGATVTAAAIAIGALVAGLLPGFGRPPALRAPGLGATTVADNPIVNIRASLVARDNTAPLLRVRSSRPVYLRTTALDVYSADEEWTNAGIRGRPVGRAGLPVHRPVASAEPVAVDVAVENLPGAILVPVPYRPLQIVGDFRERLDYDSRLATFTLDAGLSLRRGDRYRVYAAVPVPEAGTLDRADATGAHPVLPAGVPVAVGRLARDIVERAGAVTPFQQALAVQDELRTWRYSVDVPAGHSGSALESFLERRSGYCEQFAGTMAVMLRTLGIPARVAVGFTPGTPVGEGQYVVTSANAHAWVEVPFQAQGWIAFEPTPRDDGNVLVPSAANLAPALTAGQAVLAQDRGLTPEQERIAQLPDGPGGPQPAPSPAPAEPSAAGGRPVAPRPVAPLVLTLVASVGLAAAAAGGAFRHRRRARAGPATRVLDEYASVERLGRGLGIHPAAWETEREYLARLAVRVPAVADAARRLAALAAAARYAARLPEDALVAAEECALRLRAELLGSCSRAGRVLVPVRGAAWSARSALRALGDAGARRVRRGGGRPAGAPALLAHRRGPWPRRLPSR
ncbi:MAG TPA: transglutaminaseTgpA domain-containing protein, partial [Egibacteraceae bacterium]|nr:transglutaminaseTgpA domain-containing protein [Egibacteraceae bacterium]